ncbi:hypothetical protein ALI44B_04570 [Leifsonia sp. ALI-44-B]|uniref:hypothetical protein n=1 Tax=Leifsonia sp. ALI-44-B TaxID=1933776 RepID=UPI00097C5EF4|nr:hypothetical protein [Leifsonia sp. ALI-44-B]ONI63904.1 hypothetical protein ALI44B_04570 [Leifsonia sp. ALI-44-B]
MAKGISIGVASDTRDFTSGVKKGVIEPLEDAADALDDLGRDGQKNGDKLERAMRDAREETSDFKREQSELGKAIAKSSKDGGDALKRNTSESTSAAKRDLAELGNEAKANAAETFSSFDGSAESFADGIQGTLGGIVSSLGPAGAIAGAAGALGIGLVMSALEQGGEKSDEFKAKVGDLAGELIDTGYVGEASLSYVVDQLKELATATDDNEVSLAKLRKTSSESGGSFEELARAYAGNAEGLDELLAKQEEYADKLRDEADAVVTSAKGGPERYKQLMDQADATDRYVGYLKEAKTATDQAADAQQNYIDSGGPELLAKAEAAEDYATSIQDALGEAGESWEEFATKEGGVDLAGYVANFEAKAKAVEDYQKNLSTASETLSQEALNYISSLGVDSAPLLAAFINAPADQKGRLAEIWRSLGKTSTDTYKAELEAGIPKEINGPKITLDVQSGLRDAITAIDAFVNKPRSAVINLRAVENGSGRMGVP